MITEERAKKAWKNTKFILEKIAEAKKGDNIIMLADSESYANARLFCECAKDLGINSFIADVDIYGGEEGYDNIPIMEPLKQAVLHADIARQRDDGHARRNGILPVGQVKEIRAHIALDALAHHIAPAVRRFAQHPHRDPVIREGQDIRTHGRPLAQVHPGAAGVIHHLPGGHQYRLALTQKISHDVALHITDHDSGPVSRFVDQPHAGTGEIQAQRITRRGRL